MSKHRHTALAVMAQARRQVQASRREARRCSHFSAMHVRDAELALTKFFCARIWFNLPNFRTLP